MPHHQKPRTIDDIIKDALSNGLGDRLALAVALKRAREILEVLRSRCDCDAAGKHLPDRRSCVCILARHGLGMQ